SCLIYVIKFVQVISCNLPLKNPIANQPLMLILQGLVLAVIYYFGFDFAIKKFHLMTPGREPVTADDADDLAIATDADDDKYTRQAKQIYAALGGADNLTVVDNCTTRLRLQLADTSTINEAAIKHSGAAGINKLDDHNLQIIIGTEVQFVADALSHLKLTNAPITKTTTSNEAVATAPTATNITSGVTTDFYSVANGQYVDIENVDDDTFAKKMLGDGFAIDPADGTITAPVDGTVSTVFPTKHAIGFKTDSGLEILLHMGIDTVELNGAPFEVLVQTDQPVHHGEVVAKADLAAIKAAGKATTMMVIITNMDAVNLMKFKMLTNQVKVSDEIMLVTTK
ncbi:glucose PTS transporter subunit IIA, partial [Lactiplantibacillus plantarum]|uniref:glucose PTS transporter subunit IIA n=1 Tax=Lactiplantibacillus plantarum TaxID=1590 RepID=UPI00374D3863